MPAGVPVDAVHLADYADVSLSFGLRIRVFQIFQQPVHFGYGNPAAGFPEIYREFFGQIFIQIW